jgi:hypothetical protein
VRSRLCCGLLLSFFGMSCGIDFQAPTWYLVIRFLAWLTLWGASALDFYRHRGEKVYGWQLPVAIFVILCTTVAKEAVSFLYQHLLQGLYFCFILLFFDRLVIATYVAVLMLISYGWKITRDRLGDNAKTLFVVPLLFFVSSLVHEGVMQSELTAREQTPDHQLSIAAKNLIAFSSLIWTFTVLYMAVWIHQTVNVEKLVLIEKITEDLSRRRQANEESMFVDDDLRNEEEIATQQTSSGIFAKDFNRSAASDARMPTFEVLKEEVEEEDNNQFIPNSAKLTLLSRFFFAVMIYLVALTFYRLILLFKIGSVNFCALIFYDAIFFLFTASLAYIFRLREENPYFVVPRNEAVGIQDQILHDINVQTLAESESGSESGIGEATE